MSTMTTTELPTEVEVDAAQLGRLLTQGGFAEVTVRSLETGNYVCLTFSAKKRGEHGGLMPRNTLAGRVGLNDADVVFIDRQRDMMSSFSPRTGEVRHTRASTAATRWTVEKLLSWITGGYPLDQQAQVLVATRCARCGRKLRDPISLERGMGPECYGRPTGSVAAR